MKNLLLSLTLIASAGTVVGAHTRTYREGEREQQEKLAQETRQWRAERDEKRIRYGTELDRLAQAVNNSKTKDEEKEALLNLTRFMAEVIGRPITPPSDAPSVSCLEPQISSSSSSDSN